MPEGFAKVRCERMERRVGFGTIYTDRRYHLRLIYGTNCPDTRYQQWRPLTQGIDTENDTRYDV